jgi:8-oxo-dGTP pyrophosphatase MutT (NUDIX family)
MSLMVGQRGNHSALPLNIDDVRRALRQPLPGLPAQALLAPAHRTAELRDRIPHSTPKEAGVLVLLYPHRDRLYFPLTRRTESVANHRGQISLPGGAQEGEESLQETAWRETCEELGVCPDEWDSLGSLSPLYIPPSGFRIHPFVAYVPGRPAFHLDPIEVAELIETPLSLLLDPSSVRREEWDLRGSNVEVPFFYVKGHKVWGATAMVLSELVLLLRKQIH